MHGFCVQSEITSEVLKVPRLVKFLNLQIQDGWEWEYHSRCITSV